MQAIASTRGTVRRQAWMPALVVAIMHGCSLAPAANAGTPHAGTAPAVADAAPALHAAAEAQAVAPLALPAFAPLREVAREAVVPGFGKVSEAGQLERTRGGSDTTVNDTRLSGVVSGNSATQVVTGANTIASGAFTDASGIPIVIQNSGANVLIQNATVINLKFN